MIVLIEALTGQAWDPSNNLFTPAGGSGYLWQLWDWGRLRIHHPLDRQLGKFAVQNVAFHGGADAAIAGGLAACIDRAQKICCYFQTNGQG